MGYNTTVVVMNDCLDAIGKDPDFGKKLARACLQIWDKELHPNGVDVSALGCVNAATVIESHHANNVVPVLVGGNYGTALDVVQFNHGQTELLNALATKLGYRLVKKSNRKKKKSK